MRHPHSTCPVEPGCIISAVLLLFALIDCCWRTRNEPDLYRSGGRFLSIGGKWKMDEHGRPVRV